MGRRKELLKFTYLIKTKAFNKTIIITYSIYNNEKYMSGK